MHSISSQLNAAFRAAIRAAWDLDADPLVAPAQNERFGDYQSNAAMGLAKLVAERAGQKTSPRQIAEEIVAKLDLGEMTAEKPTIAGPGFINVRLNPAWLARQLNEVARDERLGVDPVRPPQTVVIDLSGPNVAKELHVGHLRSTVIGDAIARVMEFLGHKVIRQNHLGDWGTQFGMLIAHLRSQPQAAGAGIEDLDKFYKEARQRFDHEPGFADQARAAVVQLQGGDAEARGLWQRIVDETRRHFQPIYGRLNVNITPEHERGESFYNDRLPDVVRELKEKGVATQSEGATVVFVEGHENPLIIEKSGGGYLYGTTDLAAVRYRAGELRADRVIYVVGAPQSQHFAQVFATARRAGWAVNASLEHAPFGSILGEDGKMFKARSGESVKLIDLLDEAERRAQTLVDEKSPDLPEEQRRAIARAVGVGAIKYADLSKDRVGDYTFSFDQMLSMDGNTAPYLQYAYARVRSIFRKAGAGPATHAEVRLDAQQEVALAKHILRFADVLHLVARELKPHYLTTFLYDLATTFSAFYEHCPVLQSEEPTRSSRLALCDVTARTLAQGLDLLGIEHPEQM
jgi:arginyl-tRNA synthetase